MARMLPAMQRMFVSSAKNASCPAPATSTATDAANTITPAAATMADTAANARSIVSLELSDDVEVPLASLQRDLNAASDTFQLDHLDDDVPLPTYDASLELNHVPSSASPQIREAVSSPRSAPSPATGQPARADPNGHLATPARPWGLRTDIWPRRLVRGDFSVRRPPRRPATRPSFPDAPQLPALPSPCRGDLRPYHRGTPTRQSSSRRTWTYSSPGPASHLSSTA
jgi:hypothetical protein